MAEIVLYGPNARLNVTINGQNGDYPDLVDFEMDDGAVKTVVQEALQSGYIPGVGTVESASLDDFVVDRFPATDDLPPRLFLRPKTPFGLGRCPACGYYAFNGEECFDCGYRA